MLSESQPEGIQVALDRNECNVMFQINPRIWTLTVHQIKLQPAQLMHYTRPLCIIIIKEELSCGFHTFWNEPNVSNVSILQILLLGSNFFPWNVPGPLCHIQIQFVIILSLYRYKTCDIVQPTMICGSALAQWSVEGKSMKSVSGYMSPNFHAALVCCHFNDRRYPFMAISWVQMYKKKKETHTHTHSNYIF